MICFHESVLIWFQWQTCLGWVFFPSKPHLFGNKCHSTFCGLLGVMFSIEMIEGEDWQIELQPPEKMEVRQ